MLDLSEFKISCRRRGLITYTANLHKKIRLKLNIDNKSEMKTKNINSRILLEKINDNSKFFKKHPFFCRSLMTLLSNFRSSSKEWESVHLSETISRKKSISKEVR